MQWLIRQELMRSLRHGRLVGPEDKLVLALNHSRLIVHTLDIRHHVFSAWSWSWSKLRLNSSSIIANSHPIHLRRKQSRRRSTPGYLLPPSPLKLGHLALQKANLLDELQAKQHAQLAFLEGDAAAGSDGVGGFAEGQAGADVGFGGGAEVQAEPAFGLVAGRVGRWGEAADGLGDC